MLTWKLVYRLLSERCLVPQCSSPQNCESPRLAELCEELREIQNRQREIYVEIQKQAEVSHG